MFQRTKSERFIRSSKTNPCRCGRTKDGDCRSNDDSLFCHNSPLSDQFRWRGQTWFLHRTNCGHTGACKLFKPWPPGVDIASPTNPPCAESQLSSGRLPAHFGQFLCHAGLFACCTPKSATAASLHQLVEHHQQSVEEPLTGVAGVAA